MAAPHVAGVALLCYYGAGPGTGDCYGKSVPEIIQKLRWHALVYSYYNPWYRFTGDQFSPFSGKFYGSLVAADLY